MTVIRSFTGNETREELEEAAFQAFATLHPHEAYGSYPDRFWGFFKTKQPQWTRDQMEQALAMTEEKP